MTLCKKYRFMIKCNKVIVIGVTILHLSEVKELAKRSSYSSSSSSSKRLKIVVNSPVILTFVFLCVAVLILDRVTGGRAGSGLGKSTELFFSVYRSSMANPLTYIRFFGHVFGHADFSHLIGNMMLILVIGPLLEEKYGAKIIIFVMAATALITGVIHFIFFPGVALCGASGIVFAFILLSSISGFKEKEIPLTFILVALLYLGQQIYEGIFVADNVSQLTHIAGGVVGAVIGYRLNCNK